MNLLKSFWKDEEGLTTVEYALLLALLVVAAITVWSAFGTSIRSAVSTSGNTVSNAMG
jgi:pilus assembly protein Flp/PilA